MNTNRPHWLRGTPSTSMSMSSEDATSTGNRPRRMNAPTVVAVSPSTTVTVRHAGVAKPGPSLKHTSSTGAFTRVPVTPHRAIDRDARRDRRVGGRPEGAERPGTRCRARRGVRVAMIVPATLEPHAPAGVVVLGELAAWRAGPVGHGRVDETWFAVEVEVAKLLQERGKAR
jgi:hypothetical protein